MKDYRYQSAAAFILFGLVLVMTCIVTARMASADTRLTMGGGVYHIDSDRDEMNEANYFLGLSHGPAFGATFVNSHSKRSFAAGVVPRTGESLEFSAYVGGVTGYDNPDWLPCLDVDLCLFAAPSVSWWVTDDVAITGVLFGDAGLYAISVKW